MTRIFDFAANQAAWWWCILFVRADHASLALAGPAAYVVAHLVLRTAARAWIAMLAVTAGVVGFVVDSALVRAGYLSFPGGGSVFMISLWVAFGVSLTASMRFLRERPIWLAVLFGAAAGPIAYAGGERLGVLGLAPHAPVAVAVVWAAAVGALAAIARRAEAGAR